MITSKSAQLNQYLIEIGKIDFQEIRINNKDYFEAIILKSKLADLITCLEETFGVAKYPSGKELSGHVKEVTDRFGGVRGGQSLYFLEEKECSAFVMLWPWQDGTHITLKIFQD